MVEYVKPWLTVAVRLSALLHEFPTSAALDIGSLGAPANWSELGLWRQECVRRPELSERPGVSRSAR